MSPEELNSALRRRPYIPLRIHVTDGVHYDVFNPEMAKIGRTILFIGFQRNVDRPFFDEPVMVSMRHVTRVEPIVEATAG